MWQLLPAQPACTWAPMMLRFPRFADLLRRDFSSGHLLDLIPKSLLQKAQITPAWGRSLEPRRKMMPAKRLDSLNSPDCPSLLDFRPLPSAGSRPRTLALRSRPVQSESRLSRRSLGLLTR